LHRAASEPLHAAARDRAHDRTKSRLLPPGDPFLRAIGISDERGRVKPSKEAKYRQVEEFLRQLDAALRESLDAGRLPVPSRDRPLRVVDLGCGNAYLTFAAFQYLTEQLGLPVHLTGVDRKEAAAVRNRALAASLGHADELRFLAADIADADIGSGVVHVVLSLHTCDTGTDAALARAVGWRAPLILAAPCCHHYVQAQLRRSSAPPPYGLLTRHGILRERLADVLTDGMRAAELRRLGYRVEVVEFVESRHTPRNTLLRAHRTGYRNVAADADYEALVTAWQVRPKLAELLSAPS